MPIPAYVQGFPQTGSSLGSTKTQIRDNLDGTFQTLAIDHVDNNGNPGGKPAGYHTVIHQVLQTAVNTVAGYNQVFSGVPGTLVVNGVTTPQIPAGTTDSQLFALTAQGGLSQLTGAGVSGSGNGFAWCGGILIQWGNLASVVGGVKTVTLPQNFPRNFFMSQATMIRNNSNVDAIYAITPPTVGPVASIQFRDTSSGNPFYWFAIGN